VIRRERFTIVHTHTPKGALLGQLAARLAGTPIIINTMHGTYLNDYMHPLVRRFFIMIETIAARCSTLIFSVNKEDIQTAIREGISEPAKLKYLGGGFDLSLFNPERFSEEDARRCRQELGIAEGAPVVAYVGRMTRRKGFVDFLASAKIVAERHPAARFLVIGDGDAGQAGTCDASMAKDRGIAERCVFVGWRAPEEMPRYYKIMNALVLPSQTEGLPRSATEASAMGVPCVVSDVKGCREAVEEDRNGFLVPFRDVDAFARAILRILQEPETARRMGAEGRRMAAERWDERIILKRVSAEYARLLSGLRRSGQANKESRTGGPNIARSTPRAV
jgi:glycosyltransferase involved in cell wall biosynthesis